MKNIKKIFLSCLLILLTIWIAACTEKFTVTFIDVDGTVLKTEEVISGADATAPANPSYEGLEFVKWSADYTKVASDLTVQAVYFGIYET